MSEVESYFSSDEDGNLDRLELLEGRLEEACETLYVVIQRSEDLSSQNPGCIPCTSHAEDTPRVSKFHAKRPPKRLSQENVMPTFCRL